MQTEISGMETEEWNLDEAVKVRSHLRLALLADFVDSSRCVGSHTFHPQAVQNEPEHRVWGNDGMRYQGTRTGDTE